jgi:uncharacterized protein (TIGR02145 family)
MKATNWPVVTGNNSSGFSAEPGGQRAYNDNFLDELDHAFYWSSTPKGSTVYAWEFQLYDGDTSLNKYDGGKSGGNSIRCLKD